MRLSAKQKAVLSNLTKFEQSVLMECCKIPKGKTSTYSKIAAAIGKPKSARAVGNVLAKNPLAPIIPCHRVIRSDGKIGNYSGKGGAKTKRLLLRKEGTPI